MTTVNSKEYDWETERDANVLKTYAAIQKDPVRLKKATDFLKNSAEEIKQAIKPQRAPSKHNNPATIKQMTVKY